MPRTSASAATGHRPRRWTSTWADCAFASCRSVAGTESSGCSGELEGNREKRVTDGGRWLTLGARIPEFTNENQNDPICPRPSHHQPQPRGALAGERRKICPGQVCGGWVCIDL